MTGQSPKSYRSQCLIIAVSGPSSSGKTTLARLLRSIIQSISASPRVAISLFILHEDDFYKTDVDIPTRTVTSSEFGTRLLQDWDCVESLDLDLLDRVLKHVKAAESSDDKLPDDFASKEDQNTVGESGISDQEIEEVRAVFEQWITRAATSSSIAREETREIRICLLDGFLLFPPPGSNRSSGEGAQDRQGGGNETAASLLEKTTDIRLLSRLREILNEVVDVKMFLPSTLDRTIQRRKQRTGYVTLEGFWEDPPGYVEDVVWPNYARDHAWMFGTRQDCDNGVVDIDTARKHGIAVGPGTGDIGMRPLLDFGIEEIKRAITRTWT